MANKTFHYFDIISLLLVLPKLAFTTGPLCYSCLNIPHPRDCGRIVQCGDSEKCFVESFVTDSGGIFYNSGCSADFNCAAVGKRDIHDRNNTIISSKTDKTTAINKTTPSVDVANTVNNIVMVQEADVKVCYQCCDNTDYCNRDMCDRSVAPQTSGTFCLNCPDVLKPSDCEFVTLCSEDDICYTERIFINGELRYRMGCINKNSCVQPVATPIGRKRFLLEPDLNLQDYCAKCCLNNIGNCNRELCDPNSNKLPQGTQELILITPPLRTDYCQDLTPQSCKLLGLQNNKFCLSQSVKNYACREFCGTCVNTDHQTPAPTISSGVSTTTSSPDNKGCFFNSQKYEGQVSVSRTNKQCQQWSVKLQANFALAHNFPDKTVIEARNYCRDPDGKGHPWCFVSVLQDDQGWEFCDIKYCAECYFAGNSLRYNGYVDSTGPNRNCQPWNNFKLHPVPLRNSMFPEGDVGKAGSYCRDPLGVGHPVCYQNDQLTDCNIPVCTTACEDDPNTNCQALSSIICQDEYFQTLLCPRTCNKCGFALLSPVHKEPPNGICSDNPDANCPVLKLIICTDPDSARKFCPKTCNACGRLNNPAPSTTSSTTPTASTSYRVSSTQTGLTAISTTVPGYFTTVSTHLPPTTTAPLDDCYDMDGCSNPDLGDLVCSDIDLAITICPKKCNLCGKCRDATGLNCSSPSVQKLFCPDRTMSVQFCQKTCGKCAEKHIPITRNKCGDPVANEAICPFLDQEICLCNDDDLRPFLCKNYCAGSCGQKVAVNCSLT